jgi:uncharacterized protein YjbJ (UPF0337 family)
MTNLTEIQGNWEVVKGKLRQKYGILTETDVRWNEGKYDEMLYKLQIILGVSVESLNKFITDSAAPQETTNN